MIVWRNIVVTKEKVNFTSNKIMIVSGGKKRSDSVYNGLKYAQSEYVFIHDGVRPFLNKIDLEKSIINGRRIIIGSRRPCQLFLNVSLILGISASSIGLIL